MAVCGISEKEGGGKTDGAEGEEERGEVEEEEGPVKEAERGLDGEKVGRPGATRPSARLAGSRAGSVWKPQGLRPTDMGTEPAAGWKILGSAGGWARTKAGTW